jgi:integrase
MALTTIRITNLKPKKADYRVADGGGLYILVRPNGSKLWRYDDRLDGSRRTHSIGEWGEGPNRVSLKQARDAHDVARAAVARDEHPIGQKSAAALAEIEKASRKTVKEAAEGWKAHINKQSRSDKTRDRDERMVGYINGAFGHLCVEDVKALHLVALLNTFETAGSYETRSRLQSTAINIMGWAHGQAWIEHNPFVGFSFGKAFTPATNVARPAIIEAKPFGQLLRDITAYQGRQGNLVGKALQLLALTFVRPGTLLQAEWEEFDLDKALWTIPFKKLKQRKFREGIKELTSKPHFVPLSPQALALLGDLKKLAGNRRYVFPGPRGGRPLSTNALEVALKGLGYQDVHCPHGFRSSASTLLNAERVKVDGVEAPRFADQAIEFQLEHVEQSVAAIYNRDERLRERTKMMHHWADKIDELRDDKARPKRGLKVAA